MSTAQSHSATLHTRPTANASRTPRTSRRVRPVQPVTAAQAARAGRISSNPVEALAAGGAAVGARSTRPKRSIPDLGKTFDEVFQKDKQDIVTTIGRIASVLSVIMYVSYITQIMNNLGGQPGTPWQPLAAFFNCVMWTAYGFLKPKKDWPIIIANVPGIFLAGITFITALIH